MLKVTPNGTGKDVLLLAAETAFRLHKEGRLTRKELVSILQDCVNVTAIENGYADAHGLPFPRTRTK